VQGSDDIGGCRFESCEMMCRKLQWLKRIAHAGGAADAADTETFGAFSLLRPLAGTWLR